MLYVILFFVSIIESIFEVIKFLSESVKKLSFEEAADSFNLFV
jgi:hypothetical protein